MKNYCHLFGIVLLVGGAVLFTEQLQRDNDKPDGPGR